MTDEPDPETAVTPPPTHAGYVDAAQVSVNAFTLHLALGTSTPTGETMSRVEVTMSREFARHLAAALDHTLAQTEVAAPREEAHGEPSAKQPTIGDRSTTRRSAHGEARPVRLEGDKEYATAVASALRDHGYLGDK